MTSNIEKFFNLNDYERNIIWKAARAGNSPMTSAMFQLYFPQLSATEISALIRDVGKVDHMAGAA